MGCADLLILTDDDCCGGTAQVARQLAVGLSSDFTLKLAFNYRDEAQRFFSIAEAECVNSKVSESNRWKSTYHTRHAALLLDQIQPTLILFVDAGMLSSHLAFKSVAAARGIPYIMIVNRLPPETLALSNSFIDLSIQALHQAHHIVLVTERHKIRFNDFFPEIRTPVSVIRNCCSASFFNRSNGNRSHLRMQFGFAPSDLVCVTAARVERTKGQELCLRALEILQREGRHQGIKIVLAGRGNHEYVRWLHGEVEARGLSKSFIALGELADVKNILCASDVFLLASFDEGLPISILEAMATGLPIVATAVGGIPEQVGLENGYLLPPPAADEATCVAAMAEVLNHLNQNRSGISELGRVSRAKADAFFHPSIMLSNYKDLVKSTLLKGAVADIAPNSSFEPLPGFAPLKEGTIIDITDPRQAWNYLEEGWSGSEPTGVWTEGPYSTMRFSFDNHSPFVNLVLRAVPFLPRDESSQVTTIYANGHKIGRWWLNKRGSSEVFVMLNLRRLGHSILLRLEHANLESPRQAGTADDDRLICLHLEALSIRPTNKVLPALALFKSGWIARSGDNWTNG
jgi:glycosyltransferase involved in cell wall biosynthesis